MSNFHQIIVHVTSVAWSASVGVTIRSVVSFLWFGIHRRREKGIYSLLRLKRDSIM